MPGFTFLGFLHVWGDSVQRKTGIKFWRVKLRTSPIRFRKKLAEIKVFIRQNRHDKLLIARVKRIVQGYLNYFAINDNQKRIKQFIHEVRKTLFKYLNRRSQKHSFNWERFKETLLKEEFPEARILHNLFFNLRSPRSNPGVSR